MLIPLTAGEARRLFCLYTRVTHPEEFHEHWSHWRRQHQANLCVIGTTVTFWPENQQGRPQHPNPKTSREPSDSRQDSLRRLPLHAGS